MNNDGNIDWQEFVVMTISLQNKVEAKNSISSHSSRGKAKTLIGSAGSQSMYLQEEVSMLARVINQTLKNEEMLKDRLPMDPEDDDLFHACSDGLVLIYLFNKIKPNIIDIKKVYHGASNVFKTR